MPPTPTVARLHDRAENAGVNELATLMIQLEWGVDEALLDHPVDRRALPVLPVKPAVAAAVPAGIMQAQALADAARTPAALYAALASFEGCSLRATATNTVFRDGPPTSRLVLVADVPGAAEDRAGLPIAGAAADLLHRMFASAGLDRAACLATSLLPWRPPGDRKPSDAEVQLCLPFLLRHLQLVQPERVLLLGALAARALLPGSGRRARGVWHAMAVPGLPQPVPTLAWPSAAHIAATAPAKRDAWSDLLRLRRVLGDNFAHE